MKNGHLWFTVVPHEYRAFSRHLEVGTFPSYFILYSVPGTFLWADKELGCSREVVDFFKNNILKFAYAVFQVQDDGAYTLELDDPPMPLTDV